MRVPGSAEQLEDRRRRALELLDSGLSLNEVGKTLDCSPSSVMRWRDARRSGGDAALKVKAAPGRPPKLTENQRRSLEAALLEGALAAGYHSEYWTTARVVEVIERKFGVRYHRDHVGRLMGRMGWSHRKYARSWLANGSL